MSKSKNIFFYLLIIYWVSLWVSINVGPLRSGLLDTIYSINFSKNYFKSIASIRFIVTLIITSCFIAYFIIRCIKAKNKIDKIHIFFFIYFISQLIGLYFNDEKNFDIFNSFLAIFGLGTAALFAVSQNYNEDYLKYFFKISIIFLFIMLLIIFFSKIKDINSIAFYHLFSAQGTNILDNPLSRISGLSRTLALINLLLILYYIKSNLVFYKNKFFYLVTILSILIFLMQSRGTLLCLVVSILFIILFFCERKVLTKLKNFTLLLIIPISFGYLINVNVNIKNESENLNEMRVFSSHTGGRLTLWQDTLKNYDKKKLFGYGPQGDRFFLSSTITSDDFGFKKDREYYGFGNNVSNMFLYALLSGGIFSVGSIILIFYEILKVLIKNKNKLFSKKNSVNLNFSLTCLIFLLIRSVFENSFALFSVDFLLFYLSIVYVLNSSKSIEKEPK